MWDSARSMLSDDLTMSSESLFGEKACDSLWWGVRQRHTMKHDGYHLKCFESARGDSLIQYPSALDQSPSEKG